MEVSVFQIMPMESCPFTGHQREESESIPLLLIRFYTLSSTPLSLFFLGIKIPTPSTSSCMTDAAAFDLPQLLDWKQDSRKSAAIETPCLYYTQHWNPSAGKPETSHVPCIQNNNNTEWAKVKKMFCVHTHTTTQIESRCDSPRSICCIFFSKATITSTLYKCSVSRVSEELLLKNIFKPLRVSICEVSLIKFRFICT